MGTGGRMSGEQSKEKQGVPGLLVAWMGSVDG